MADNENMKRDLTGALKALESNNAIIPPEEQAKREEYVKQEAATTAASLIKPLRTFESDAAEAIEEGKKSLYSISEAEKTKQKKEKARDPEKEEVKKNSLLLILSGVLFLAGAIFVTYLILLKVFIPTTNTKPVVKINSIIPSSEESVIEISATSSTPKSIVATLNQGQLAQGKIENLRFVQNGGTANITDVLSGLSATIPTALLRSLNGGNYMIGAIGNNGRKELFLIGKINYYDNAFASMLEWEKDIPAVFASLGFFETISKNQFVDTILKNKNARVLKDNNGIDQAVYGFYDNSTLIITVNSADFETIIGGLTTSTLVR